MQTCVTVMADAQGCHLLSRDANVFGLRFACRVQQPLLLVCRLLFEVLYEVFHEQWYCASRAQQPGMAVLRKLFEQVNPSLKPFVGPALPNRGRAM